MITFVTLVLLLNIHVTLTPTSAVGEAVVVVAGGVVLLNVVVDCVFDVLVVEGATVVLAVIVGPVVVVGPLVVVGPPVVVVVSPRPFP
jgi:hypothetical protein